jgi:2,3-bisphosphoglycerate-independent phosphoglycerate mutase
MSAGPVTDEVVKQVSEGRFDFIVLNYANPDMVGHTGNLPAAVRAMEFVDACVGRVVEAVSTAGGSVILTADHGNCEKMADPEGAPHTAHTTNLVPLVLVDAELKNATLRSGILADIAPTILDLMGLPKPAEMTGRSLLQG